MKSGTFFVTKTLIFMFILIIVFCGFQVKRVETISGAIGNVNKDAKSITVNEGKIAISPQTKIVDEKGNVLRIEDLNPNLPVQIEGVRNPDGFSARKIVVKTPKKGP